MGRRSTGSIEARENYIRLKFTHLGKRHVERLDLKPVPANLKAAEKMMARIQGAINAGVFRHSDFFDGPGKAAARQSFADYAEVWLSTLVRAKSTRRLYATAIRRTWNPAFGDLALAQIRHSDIKAAIAKRDAVVSAGNLNSHITVIRLVFASAMADQLLTHNPADGIKSQKVQKTRPDPFSADERDLILDHMRAKFDGQIANYYALAFFTGMRPSEQIARTWGDVDWRLKKISVHSAFVEHEEKSTKTNRARKIDLSAPALAALTRQKAHTFMLGEKPGTGVIFRNPNTGNPWSDVNIQRISYFAPTLVALGIRQRDAYQTRHTFATLLLMGGVNPAYISKQLGHATLAMLFDVYATWLEDADGGRQASLAADVMAGIVPQLSREKDA